MPLQLTIDIRDAITPHLRRLGAAIASPGLRRAIGAAARNTIIAHLSNLQSTRPNKQGWPRQGYWAAAARSVTQPIDHGNTIVIAIQQTGIALHYYGGTITPKQSKYLTIPAVPEAYGTRARDARWQDRLRFALLAGKPALVAKVNFYRAITKGRRAGQRQFATGDRAKHGASDVVYWLIRSAAIRPDPSILPAADTILHSAAEAARRYVDAILARRH